ncbi:hypothetical protein PMAYCL1PPCAC_02484, partial [Pristionchus mayeri]
ASVHLIPRHFAPQILLIENTRVFVSNQLLAMRSPFFNSLFYGEYKEREKEEIELKDVKLEEFLDLLDFVYEFEQAQFIDSNVSHILKLADRFSLTYMFDNAQQFLKRESRLDASKKILLAETYRMQSTMDYVVFGLCQEEIEELKEKEEYAGYSDATKACIEARLTYFHNAPTPPPRLSPSYGLSSDSE